MRDPKTMVILVLAAALAVLAYLYYDSQRNTVRIQLPGVKIDAR
jgi:hypothetical protein